jgi:APA family basic amino acid/polyamine antiporter
LANLYAFGATLGYTLVMISLVRLRLVDPYTPRPYRVPLNVALKTHRGEVHFPILGVVGLLAIAGVLLVVLYTHSIARIAGPFWVLFCFCYYAWYRRRQKLPILRSVPRDWETLQKEVLTSAEEYDLLEQYTTALMVRDRARLREKNHAEKPRS